MAIARRVMAAQWAAQCSDGRTIRGRQADRGQQTRPRFCVPL